MPAVREIVRRAARDDYRFSALVLGVVESVPMQMRIKHRRRSQAGASEPHVHHEEASVSSHAAARRGSRHRAAAARLDGSGARRRSRRPPPARRAGSAASTFRTARRWTSGRRPRRARGFELSEILAPLEPFRDQLCVISGLAHARRRAVDRRGHGRRRESRARGGRVLERRASRQRRPRDRRSRASISSPRRTRRPGHAAAVGRAVDRGGRAQLRREFHLRVPQHAVVEVGDVAAADGEQPAGRVRAPVRRRQHRRRARGAARRGAQPARLRHRPGRARCARRCRPPIARGSPTTSTRCARSSGAC